MKQLADLTVSLFLLAGFMPLFSADMPVIEGPYYVVAGQSFTLPLGYKSSLGKEDRLVWMHTHGVMYKSKANENKCRVDESGSLLLPAELLAVAGEKHSYTAEVHDKDGNLRHSLKTSIHLLAEVPTPTMEVACKEETVVFTCNVSERQDLVIKWTVGNNKEQLKAIKTLTKPKVFKELVKCTVSNNASAKSSHKDPAAHCPPDPILTPENLLIVYYVAGGVGFLVLIIVIITCCVRACHRKKNRQQMESELRLEWSKQAAKEDQQQQQHQKKKPRKKTAAKQQQSGPNPHSCKSSGEPHRPRNKDTMANPSAGTKPGRTRPSPKPPQQERDMAVVQMDHGPPLPKPRKKNTPTRP